MKYYVEEKWNEAVVHNFDYVFRISNFDFESYSSTEFGILSPPQTDCCLFIVYSTINDIIESDHINLETWLEKFFKYNSYLIINQPYDSINMIIRFLSNEEFYKFEKYKNRVLFYQTGELEPHIETKLKGFNVVKRQESEGFWVTPPFYYNKKIQDLDLARTNKFLLTTVYKGSRQWRRVLVEHLQKQNLLDHYIGRISELKNLDQWVGDTFLENIGGKELTLSWDLYNRASFEIVPETLYDHASYITEKTLKPMIAQIPFLILSNPGFYRNLKRLGFKTFDSLIDESFAYETDFNLRAEKLANTAKDIVDNGPLEFYNAAKDICSHNFFHLLDMKPKEEYASYMSLYNFKQHLGINT